MFGRRNIRPNISKAKPNFPPPTIDSDGKRRVIGERVFAGPHGDKLRMLGFGLNDAANVMLDDADIKQMMQASLARQEMRRQRIEADLLARHGYNTIRPFFILSEQTFGGVLGNWLLRMLRLMPHDDWNIVYLPMDSGTKAAMRLPSHPRQSIKPIDELMVKQITVFYTQFMEEKRQVDARVAQVGWDAALPALDRFVDYADKMPRRIIDHVDTVRPIIIELIADVQRRAH